jgi:zinc protease
MTVSSKRPRVRAVTTSGGIDVWHVEDYTVPVVSLRFAFAGGAAQERDCDAGLAMLMTGLLDEGAGEDDATRFQERLEERAIELGFDADRDYINGSLRFLAEEASAAFDLLGQALQAPRFDDEAIARVRAQTIAELRLEENDPQARAMRAFAKAAFEGHPYGRSAKGDAETLASITREALLAQHRRLVSRAHLSIVAVGAIAEAALIAGIERAFAGLPERAERMPVPRVTLGALGQIRVDPLDVPQSTLLIGLPGVARLDPDYPAADVVNHILGGGAFTSRLWMEVRETRGLAYSVWSRLIDRVACAHFLAGTTTSNARAAEALRVIAEEIAKMADTGPEPAELAKAKRFLLGAFALRFDTSRKIAGELLGFRLKGLGIDYLERYGEEVDRVDHRAAKGAARRLLAGTEPFVVAVGAPEGISAREAQG